MKINLRVRLGDILNMKKNGNHTNDAFAVQDVASVHKFLWEYLLG